jgi:hemoglobin
MKKRNGIETKEDIAEFVHLFYGRVLSNEILKPFFKGLNLEMHLQRMISFWNFAILEIPGYTTNLHEVHKKIPLNKVGFQTWIRLFNQTIDELHEGPNTEKAKQKVLIIGMCMEHKIVGN